MLNAAFFARGPVYLVGTSPVNCAVTDGSGMAPSYRLKCIAAARAYITWGNSGAVTSAGAPTAGVPSTNTVGMEPGGIEVFNGFGPWFIASAAGAFEVTPGEGE